eukprot:7762620-Lingulodinium_polyedra.AAC.1
MAAVGGAPAREKPRVRPIQVGESIRKVIAKRINNIEQMATQRKQFQARQGGGSRFRAEQQPSLPSILQLKT